MGEAQDVLSQHPVFRKATPEAQSGWFQTVAEWVEGGLLYREKGVVSVVGGGSLVATLFQLECPAPRSAKRAKK